MSTEMPAGGATIPVENSSQTPAPTSWTEGFAPDLKGYVETKGFKDPGVLADSYRNLEKLIGVPQERVLKLPDKADDPEWSKVYDRLGKPSKAEEYGIKDPDVEFTKHMQTKFHEANLTKAQAEKVYASWKEYHDGVNTKAQTAHDIKAQQEEAQLKSEWGAAYDKHKTMAANAKNQFGIPDTALDALESAMGFSGAMKLLHSLGSKIGEPNYVGPEGGSRHGALTPDSAKNAILMKMGDGDFVRRLDAKDPIALKEWENLHVMQAGVNPS